MQRLFGERKVCFLDGFLSSLLTSGDVAMLHLYVGILRTAQKEACSLTLRADESLKTSDVLELSGVTLSNGC